MHLGALRYAVACIAAGQKLDLSEKAESPLRPTGMPAEIDADVIRKIMLGLPLQCGRLPDSPRVAEWIANAGAAGADTSDFVCPVTPVGVRIENGKINGSLFLTSAGWAGSLPGIAFRACEFAADEPKTAEDRRVSIDISSSSIRSMTLNDCRFTRLEARGSTVTSVFSVRNCSSVDEDGECSLLVTFSSLGPANFELTRFRGLDADDQSLTFYNSTATALFVTDAIIAGGFDMSFSTVSSALTLDCQTIERADKLATCVIDKLRVDGDLLLRIPKVHGGISAQLARINGALEILAEEISGPVRCPNMIVAANMDLAPLGQANLAISSSVELNRCEIGGSLSIVSVEVRGQILLSASVIKGTVGIGGYESARVSIGGQINLRAARIGGQLVIDHSDLCKNDVAIDLFGATCGTVSFNDISGGPVHARLTTIDGECQIWNAELSAAGVDRHNEALDLKDCKIAGNLFLPNDCRFDGVLNLSGAHIAGYCMLIGAHVEGRRYDDANVVSVMAQRIKVTGSVQIDECMLKGGIKLEGCSIGGACLVRETSIQVLAEMPDARFSAFVMRGEVQSDCALNFKQCDGLLMLSGKIGGRFSIYGVVGGSRELSMGLMGLSCSYLEIKAQASGGMLFDHVNITGGLDIVQSEFKRLAAGGVQINQSSVGGQFRMVDCKVCGFISIDSSKFGYANFHKIALSPTAETDIDRDADPEQRPVLRFQDNDFGAEISMLDITGEGGLRIDLRNSRAGVLRDDAQRTYNGPTEQAARNKVCVQLEGFAYQKLGNFDGGKPLSLNQRLQWLKLGRLASKTHLPTQPFLQLASAYQGSGDSEAARRVLRRMRSHYARQSESWITRPFSMLYGLGFGYGLSAPRAIITLVVSLLLGWGATLYANNVRHILVIDSLPVSSVLRTDGDALTLGMPIVAQPAEATIACGNSVNELLYAIDIFLPLLDLRQEALCAIRSEPVNAQWSSEELNAWRFAKALYAILGWVVVSLSILTFTGILSRTEK